MMLLAGGASSLIKDASAEGAADDTEMTKRTMKNELRVALFRITFAGIGAFVAAAAVGAAEK